MNVRFVAKGGIAVAICLLASRCRPHEKTRDLRVTEPRLSGYEQWQPCARLHRPDRVVESARCGDANPLAKTVSLTGSECEDDMNTPADAVHRIALSPDCTDAAVEKLEAFAARSADAGLLSDLAGAYYLRAQRHDRPSDFVRALDAAERACQKTPALPAARFNRALGQEALGFLDDALKSWDVLRQENLPGWAGEAAEHYRRLLSTRSRLAAVQWKGNQELLTRAARARDRKAVTALVAPYCTASRHYVEDEILPAWAEAYGKKSPQKAGAQLDLAEMIAAALGEVTHDRQLIDVVDQIRSERDPRKLMGLAAAYRAFGRARKIEITIAVPAGPAFEAAESALDAAASPLRSAATLGRATALAQQRRFDEAHALLRSIESEANERQYRDLAARVHSSRGYALMARGYDMAALAEYTLAQSAFTAANDLENAGAVQNITVGLLRRIGDETLTWRAAYKAQRYLPNLADPQFRHAYLGECAVSAAELGYPSVALRYQNLAVQMLEDNASSATDDANVKKLRHNLGIALRARAAIHASLKKNDAATADLASSRRLLAEGDNVSIPVGFQARLAEAEALELEKKNENALAIEKLTEAINLASKTYYQSLTASLRLERAGLYRLGGNRPAATEDLLKAIAILRDEEKAALDPRTIRAGQAERLWSPFFARSLDAYRRLIRLYIEDHDDAEAFKYAERARAYEPLHQILQRKDLPAEFRDRIHDDEPLGLADVKEIVPAGTYLLEYSVMDDQTYVWLITHGFSARHRLPVGEAAIRRWAREIQRFADAHNGARFEAALREPYQALFQGPLSLIPSTARIVIVPDRSMHGLPFAALHSEGPYLIHDHPIAVAASATLYDFSLAQNRALSRDTAQSVLLLADPAFDPRLPAALKPKDLQSARAEAEAIQALYTGVADARPPLMREKATVPAFLSAAGDSTILHLAVHGAPSAADPLRSYLLLAPAGDDNGVLDAERLLQQLRLTKTRLAVLSACSSAGGTPVGPEGLAPLVRPFVIAGVPAVVGTLWKVSDSVATEDLLVRFHQYYRNGRDADVALQLAQREMSESPSKARKAAWAWSAFQLYGYASSPFRPASNH